MYFRKHKTSRQKSPGAPHFPGNSILNLYFNIEDSKYRDIICGKKVFEQRCFMHNFKKAPEYLGKAYQNPSFNLLELYFDHQNFQCHSQFSSHLWKIFELSTAHICAHRSSTIINITIDFYWKIFIYYNKIPQDCEQLEYFSQEDPCIKSQKLDFFSNQITFSPISFVYDEIFSVSFYCSQTCIEKVIFETMKCTNTSSR